MAYRPLEDQDWVQPVELGNGSALTWCLLSLVLPSASTQNLPPAFSSSVGWSVRKYQNRKWFKKHLHKPEQ